MKLDFNLFNAKGYLTPEAKEFMRSRGIRSAENLLSRCSTTSHCYYYKTELTELESGEEDDRHPFDRDDLTITGHMAMVIGELD